MSATLNETSYFKTQFDVPSYIWSGEEDEDLGQGDSASMNKAMPASPDSVMFGKQSHSNALVPHNVDEFAIFNFDSDVFTLERPSDLETFKLFECDFPGEDSLSDDSASLPAESPKTSNVVTAKRSVATVIQEQPVKKRSKTLDTASSDEESKPSKKAKASPKLPRSRKPTSVFRGVSRCTKDGRWQARIRVAKEVVYLGRFPTEEQAARRYDEAARLHHDTQAMLNFVTPEDILLGRKSVFSMDKNAVMSEDEF